MSEVVIVILRWRERQVTGRGASAWPFNNGRSQRSVSIRDTPLLISCCRGEERLIQQPSKGGNTVACRVRGSTSRPRAASETNSTPQLKPGVSHLRQMHVTFVFPITTAKQPFHANHSIATKIFRYETLRRLSSGYRPGEGRR